MSKPKEEAKPYCSSKPCCKKKSFVPKKVESKFVDTCPDCGYYLLWATGNPADWTANVLK